MFSTATKNDLNKTKNAAQNAAYDASDDMSSMANQAGRKVRKLYESAADEISHAGETVTTEIRSNPVRSSAIALGIGVLLGAFIRR